MLLEFLINLIVSEKFGTNKSHWITQTKKSLIPQWNKAFSDPAGKNALFQSASINLSHLSVYKGFTIFGILTRSNEIW